MSLSIRPVCGAFPPFGAAVVCLCGLLLGFAAHAARPMVVDDARIIDPKSCQLETWLQYSLGSTEYWALPGCNFTQNFEVTLGGAIEKEGRQKTRLTDIMFHGKTMFKDLEPDSPRTWALGLVFGNLRRPRVHSDRSPFGDVYLFMPASFAFLAERIVVHLNFGWLYEKEWRGHHLRWGVGLELQLAKHTWLVAEAFSENSSGSFYQVGLRTWLLPGRIQIDGTMGNHLYSSKAGDRWFSIGLQLMSPAFLP